MMSPEAPQRSCIACRTTTDKGELLRFVITPDKELVADLLARLPGRGAYTCMKPDCIRTALGKKLFQRALKAEIAELNADLFISGITHRVRERIASYVALANKAGKVVSGSDMVIESIKRKRSGLVIIASDVSPEIGEKIQGTARRCEVPSKVIFDKERLGELLGKGLRSVVAVEHGGFVEAISKEVSKYRNFLEGGVDAR